MERISQLLSIKHARRLWKKEAPIFLDHTSNKQLWEAYQNDLQEFTVLLNTTKIDDSTEVPKRIKNIVESILMKYKGNFKEMMILLFKFLHSYIIIADLSVTELKLLKDITLDFTVFSFGEILNGDAGESTSLHAYEKTSLFNYLSFGFGLKVLNYKKDVKKIKNNNHPVDQRIKRRKLNSSTKKYNVPNKFFESAGYFCPTFYNNTELEEDIKSFEFREGLRPAYNQLKLAPIEVTQESEIETLIQNAIMNAEGLIIDENGKSFELEIKRQKRLPFKLGKYDHHIKVTPDLILSFGSLNIPLEVKYSGLERAYDDFNSCIEKTFVGAKPFIEIYSQAFAQALACDSNFFILSDYSFTILCAIDDQLLPTDAVTHTNLRSIRSSCFTVNNSNYGFTTIIMIMISYCFKHRSIINLDNFREKLIPNKERLSQKINSQYDILIKFTTKIQTMLLLDVSSTIHSADLLTLPKSGNSFDEVEVEVEVEVLREIQNELRSLGVEVSRTELERFGKIYFHKNFKLINFEDLNISKIIRGRLIHQSFSTIAVLNENSLIKLYDPCRLKWIINSNTDFSSFQEILSAVFSIFIREVLSYIYLRDATFIPKLINFGFIQSQFRGFMKRLDLKKSIPFTGFYLILEKKDSRPLKHYRLNEQIAKLVEAVIEDLHSKNISHGDLHPENILYNKKLNQVTLIDFGMSFIAYNRGNYGRKEVPLTNNILRLLRKRQRQDWNNYNKIFFGIYHRQLD
ncbi:uncharacterized protein RJT21DRAFT_120716 [Scheffersomyces amazonensis]|uniref:uncharacterized protein n=1 Tax=Scheffersomyces amazonensis TaxID=1078765 RepID=UPI00315CF429